MKTEIIGNIPTEAFQAARKEVHREALREAIAERDAAREEIARLCNRRLRNTAITVVNFLEPIFPGVSARLEGLRLHLASQQTIVDLLIDAANVTYEDFGDKAGRRILMEGDYDRIRGGGIRGALYTHRLENNAGTMRKMNREERVRYAPLKLITQNLAVAASTRVKENNFFKKTI